MIEEYSKELLAGLLNLERGSRIFESLHFFIYDSIKIILLLFSMIAIIGFLRSYISEKEVKRWINKRNKLVAHISASLFGALTPFCSCSSIPIFISFIKAKIPLGISFSFLITSPLINEYLVVLMLGFFGWKITLAYILSGIILGVFSGIILGNMKIKRYIDKDMLKSSKKEKEEIPFKTFKDRVIYGIEEAAGIVKKLWVWIIAGVGVGAIIHNYVPAENIQSIISAGGYLTIPVAVILGIPMYASCAAIVPVAVVLFNKGVPLGAALSFMMATSALSLPEAIILRRAMKLKLILIFFSIVGLSIIFTGYVFNLLQGILI